MVFHGEALLEPDPSNRHALETNSPLSQSIIWEWLRRYYNQMAETAWSTNEVPMFISSNARLCRDYASLVFAYMRDYYADNKKGPIYILELGAGHGRFTYLFTRALMSLKPAMKALGFPEKSFVMVFTDMAMGNIDACRQREGMQEFIRDGIVDFMLFNCNDPEANGMRLLVADKCIEKGSPLIAIGNYVMDSLLTDAIRIIPDAKQQTADVYLARLSVYINGATRQALGETDPQTRPDLLPKATYGWRYEKVDFDKVDTMPISVESSEPPSHPFCLGAHFGELETSVPPLPASPDTMPNEIMPSSTPPPLWMTEDPGLFRMIRAYERECVKLNVPISMTIPLGALRTLGFLRSWSNGELLTIIGDKGASAFTNMCGLRHPHMAIHGTVSFGCNFHALKAYAKTIGGFHFSTPFKGSFHVTGLCFGSSSFPSIGAHMTSRWQDLDADNLIAVMQAATQLEAQLQTIPLRLLSSLMRLSCHDPDVLTTYRKSLLTNCEPPEMTPFVQPEMLLDIATLYANWFPLRDDEDFPELCAHMCLKMGRAKDAIFYFREFLRRCPTQVTASTLINFAGCLRADGNLEEAGTVVDQALQRWPAFEPALSLKTTLQMCRAPMRVTVVGCGRFAHDFTVFLNADERCRLVGVSDPSAESAQRLIEVNSLSSSAQCRPYAKSLQETLGPDGTDIVLLDLRDPQEWMRRLKECWALGVHVISSRRCDLGSAEVVDLLKTLNVINRSRHQNNQHVLMWHVHTRELMEDFPKWLPLEQLGQFRTISIVTRIVRHATVETPCEEYINEELARIVELAKQISGFTPEHLGLSPQTHPQLAAGWLHLVKVPKQSEGPNSTSRKESCAVTFSIILADSGIASTKMTICGSEGKLDVSGHACYWEFGTSLVSTSKMSRKKYFTTPTQNSIDSAVTTAHGLNNRRQICLSKETVQSLTGLTGSASALEALKLSASRGGIAVTTNSKSKPEEKKQLEEKAGGKASLLAVS